MCLKTPKPPDPVATAGAQTSSNIGTAIAQQLVNQTDQVTPNGTLSYEQTGNTKWRNPLDGKTYRIPKITATQTLSKAGKKAQGFNDETSVGLARLGRNQTKRLNSLLGRNVSFDGAGALPKAENYTANRKRVEGALLERMNPHLDRDRENLRTRLIQSGVTEGSSAWNDAMFSANQQANDARYGAIANAGSEVDREFGQALTLRNQGINEILQLRNQPINEVTALMSGGQIAGPQFVSSPQAGVANTDYAGLVQNNYAAQTKAQGQKLGALFSLGGKLGAAGIGAF